MQLYQERLSGVFFLESVRFSVEQPFSNHQTGWPFLGATIQLKSNLVDLSKVTETSKKTYNIFTTSSFRLLQPEHWLTGREHQAFVCGKLSDIGQPFCVDKKIRHNLKKANSINTYGNSERGFGLP